MRYVCYHPSLSKHVTVLAILVAYGGCSVLSPDLDAILNEARRTGDHSGLVGEIVDIPAGRFLMGDDHSTQMDERPRHPVTVPGFKLGKYEITRGQFLLFVRATGYQNTSSCWGWHEHGLETRREWSWQSPGFAQNDDHPVACISWDDAQAYLRWLNAVLAPTHHYRLPSEAEWEYAARANSQTRFPWGDVMMDRAFNCWVCDDPFEHTAPVGSFPANAFGLHDMSGNQWEWVQDCYVEHYRNASPAGSAQAFSACPSHVVRGGSWGDNAAFLRAAYRVPYLAGYRQQAFGFRLAQDN